MVLHSQWIIALLPPTSFTGNYHNFVHVRYNAGKVEEQVTTFKRIYNVITNTFSTMLSLYISIKVEDDYVMYTLQWNNIKATTKNSKKCSKGG